MQVLVKKYIRKESTSGIILIFATILALLLNNSIFSEFYTSFLQTEIVFKVGHILDIQKPLILWINDGLMAIFFLLIGLEIKRELIAGHLSTPSKIALPAIAALGGMVVPALIYFIFNYGDDYALKGWAIPTATDIAFALGILSLLGRRIPASLKIFLMALAIFDDLGAILIIALFYTNDLSFHAISLAGICIILLILLNRFKVTRLGFYILLGVLLWIFVLKSGVHATLAGIIVAFTIPLHAIDEKRKIISPVKSLQHHIHYWVAFYILPLFAFVNAGVDLSYTSLDKLSNPTSMGIIFGLFIGKQLGVFLFSYLAIKYNIAKFPRCTNWAQLYGVSVLTGIGFTMSLFIDSLAFENSNVFFFTDKLAILIGSFASGIMGYLILRFVKSRRGCSI
ncbi:Na+/H+ antiporter NhaA [Halarcobacter ebronensis]|uniref:Na(+)/H(+) antiporter NhaA n=1 Tax=Halarcobacter ebronensis TaxID=1462615 RepID=A0A4Q1AMS0_9BACT|nr:Na+/H+ antiporter NhaA [Halarcobacter ebronensis]QKF83163.1 sodium:proton antiporter [Halarcobacter ebronensis]RXK05199.1 Na+/H+ antiporter NhaA [Halarcobacter ebronensis]